VPLGIAQGEGGTPLRPGADQSAEWAAALQHERGAIAMARSADPQFGQRPVLYRAQTLVVSSMAAMRCSPCGFKGLEGGGQDPQGDKWSTPPCWRAARLVEGKA